MQRFQDLGLIERTTDHQLIIEEFAAHPVTSAGSMRAHIGVLPLIPVQGCLSKGGPRMNGTVPSERGERQQDFRLLIGSQPFDPNEAVTRVRRQAAADIGTGSSGRSEAAREATIVQFAAALAQPNVACLRAEYSLKLDQYIPNLAFLERLTQQTINRLKGDFLAIIPIGDTVALTAESQDRLEVGTAIALLVLGQVVAILPRRDHELLRLQMDAIGVLDFDQGTAALDATLYDSRLLRRFPLTGDMAMRLQWEGSRTFALAVGGLHPAFRPPHNFPKLARLALDLSTGDNPRLRARPTLR
jgi:hypothetical protein